MMSRIVLCADSETMRQPALLGLSGENLAAQDWLALFTSAEEARGFLRNDDAIDEVWVASSDDVDPINLAAAVKRDRRERGVYLLAFQGTGSLWSRANAAGIDATLSHQAFVQRYTQEKRRRGVRATTMTAPLRVSSPLKERRRPKTARRLPPCSHRLRKARRPLRYAQHPQMAPPRNCCMRDIKSPAERTRRQIYRCPLKAPFRCRCERRLKRALPRLRLSRVGRGETGMPMPSKPCRMPPPNSASKAREAS